MNDPVRYLRLILAVDELVELVGACLPPTRCKLFSVDLSSDCRVL